MKKLIMILVLAITFVGCEPDLCEDCFTVTNSDGSSYWTCIEYDCSGY